MNQEEAKQDLKVRHGRHLLILQDLLVVQEVVATVVAVELEAEEDR
jgi:hypothetical protein